MASFITMPISPIEKLKKRVAQLEAQLRDTQKNTAQGASLHHFLSGP